MAYGGLYYRTTSAHLETTKAFDGYLGQDLVPVGILCGMICMIASFLGCSASHAPTKSLFV